MSLKHFWLHSKTIFHIFVALRVWSQLLNINKYQQSFQGKTRKTPKKYKVKTLYFLKLLTNFVTNFGPYFEIHLKIQGSKLIIQELLGLNLERSLVKTWNQLWRLRNLCPPPKIHLWWCWCWLSISPPLIWAPHIWTLAGPRPRADLKRKPAPNPLSAGKSALLHHR